MIRLCKALTCKPRKPPLQERARPPPANAASKAGYLPTHLRIESKMLTTAFPFLLPDRIEAEIPARLRDLADDLERIRSGQAPSEEDLKQAPLIVEWRCIISPFGMRLMGFVAGHPLLGNRNTMTSQIWAADSAGKWVRTLSRFYNLGIPHRGLANIFNDLEHDRSGLKGGL